MEEVNSIMEEISPDETVNAQGRAGSPVNAATIDFIIKREYQEYVRNFNTLFYVKQT